MTGKPDNVVHFPNVTEPRQFWLSITPTGTELRFAQEPTFPMMMPRVFDEPSIPSTIRVWAYRGREFAITHPRPAIDHFNNRVFMPVPPLGRGWVRCRPPEFLHPLLRTERPTAVWVRKAVRR